MKKIILTCAVAITAFFTACSDGNLLPTDETHGPTVVGFANSFESYSYFSDEGQVQKEVIVQLVANNGKELKSDLTVAYEIDPSSTAVEGTEFEFVNNTGSVTIPAGSSFVTFPILVNTGSFNATQATQLVLKLAPQQSDVVAAANLQTVVINFVGCISTIQTGAYTAVVQPGSSASVGGTFQCQVLATPTVNTFKISQTAPFVPGSNYTTAVSDYGFTFNDVCGELSVNQQTLFNYYSNIVSGVAATTPDGVLTGQQGMVTSPSTFVLYHRVASASTVYNMYVKYTKN